MFPHVQGQCMGMETWWVIVCTLLWKINTDSSDSSDGQRRLLKRSETSFYKCALKLSRAQPRYRSPQLPPALQFQLLYCSYLHLCVQLYTHTQLMNCKCLAAVVSVA